MKQIGLWAACLALCNYAAASLMNCECSPGAQGAHGYRGAQGATGDLGLPGAMGNRGYMGRNGPTGDAGEKGVRGPTGGWEGPAGPRGRPGPPGMPGNCFDCAPWGFGRSWSSGAGFGGGVGADGAFTGGGGMGGGSGNNGFGSGYGYGSGPNSGGGGSGGGGNMPGLTPGNLIMLPQLGNLPQFPQRQGALLGGAFLPDSIVIISPNGEPMALSSLQSLSFPANRGEAPRPEFMSDVRPQQQWNGQPDVRPLQQWSGQPEVRPLPDLHAITQAHSTPSLSHNSAAAAISELNDWQRELLLGEFLSNQSSVNSAATNVPVMNAGAVVDVDNNNSAAPTKQPFQIPQDTALDTQQVEDSLAEFQRALDEFRKRFAKLSAYINRKGRQIAIVL